jgi:heme exporter protein A
MPGLTLDNVSMAYGRRTLFRNVCAHVGPGETLVVTGANGTGKSTLLKIIAGLARPEEGAVKFPGGQAALGYAAPDVHLYAELTGNENLEFFRRLRGLPSDAADGLLTQVGLSPARGGDAVGAYSSGMRQRLKLAVSLLGAPLLLVWDEPTLALDAAGVALTDALLCAHRERGGLAVLATNDPAESERWADLRLALG